jgi:MFS family permease
MDGKRGWWVVFGGFLSLAITSGILFFSLPAMLTNLQADTGWTLTQISLALTLGGLPTAAFSPFCGAMIDRYGARRIMLIGTVCSCLLGVTLTRVTELWQFYIVFALLFISTVSNTYIPVAAVVARWFVKLRGVATGVAMLGLGFGGGIAPLVAEVLMRDGGWRHAFLLMSVGVLIALIPIAIWVRNPDPAEEEAYAAAQGEGIDPEHDLTIQRAMRTRSFWGLSIGDMLTGLVFAIFNFHLVYYLTTDLADEKQATQIYSVFLACLALGVMVFGPLADLIQMRIILTICYLLPALAVSLLLPSKLTVGMAFGFAIVGGLAGGGRSALFPTALVHCFGETHMASIFGLSNTLFILGNSVGPLIGGAIYDETTSTRAVYVFSIVVLALSAGLVSLIRPERILQTKTASATL